MKPFVICMTLFAVLLVGSATIISYNRLEENQYRRKIGAELKEKYNAYYWEDKKIDEGYIWVGYKKDGTIMWIKHN